MDSNALATLYRLQQCERDLAAVEQERKRATEVKVLAEVQERQEKFTKLHAAVGQRLRAAQKRVRTAELSLASAEEGRAAVQQRLYGGEVTSSKELAQLEGRLKSMDQDVETHEAELLAAMESVEELQAQLAKVEAGSARSEAQLKVATERLAHKQSEWDLKTEILLADREDMRASITPTLLSLYDRKKATTRGEPVAYVQRGVCGGCRMELPAAIRSRRGKELTACEQCGRLLYWPE